MYSIAKNLDIIAYVKEFKDRNSLKNFAGVEL